MRSLALLLKRQPKRIYPGHGPIIEEGSHKIQEYVDHRNARERQIQELMTQHQLTHGERPSVAQIVAFLYPDIPSAVIPSAERNVSQHLSKLQKDGVLLPLH